ncbi:MAG: A/G-specific adenine glycosylase [Bacteroidetes bacterium]|nr:A/G-specific adenine glycosylase [Bacteroidota bacterium]
MAQQTQVSRVADYYRRWLKQFPTFTALSNASASEVLRAWSGLGYNSRALRLHQLAKTVSKQFRSQLPHDSVALQALPGIGRYTANAICCFAFDMRVPVVDVNIRRILTRWTRSILTSAEQLPENEVWRIAETLLPAKHSHEWNQALMDFGAMVCTARNPQCAECPVSKYCASAFAPAFLQKVTKKKRSEPSWKGVPRRLYRGRILKMLHHHSFSATDIAASLWTHPSRQDINWINSLMLAMHRDGLVSVRGNSFRIVGS